MQLRQQLGGGRALVLPLGQQPRDQCGQTAMSSRRQRWWISQQNACENVVHRISVERTTACEPFVGDHAETEDIGSAINGFPSDLFGRHVRSGSHDRSGSRTELLEVL